MTAPESLAINWRLGSLAVASTPGPAYSLLASSRARSNQGKVRRDNAEEAGGSCVLGQLPAESFYHDAYSSTAIGRCSFQTVTSTTAQALLQYQPREGAPSRVPPMVRTSYPCARMRLSHEFIGDYPGECVYLTIVNVQYPSAGATNEFVFIVGGRSVVARKCSQSTTYESRDT